MLKIILTAFEFTGTFILMLQNRKLFYTTLGLLGFTIALLFFQPLLKNIFVKSPIEISLQAESSTVSALGNRRLYYPLNKGKYTGIIISYKNNTSSEISKIRVYLFANDSSRKAKHIILGSKSTSTTKFYTGNGGEGAIAINIEVFPSLKPGQSQQVKAFVAAKEPGSIEITAKVKSNLGLTDPSKPITINVLSN